MRFLSETLSLSNTVFTLLRDLIQERTGIYYETSSQDFLADKLLPCALACGFTSFLDYYYLLKYDDTAKTEWNQLIDAITVQETFFWREIDQIKTLVEVLVPEYFATYKNAPLKIWSAACATGEEPLTIAMALQESGWLQRVPIKIYASDASENAIAKAKQGIYQERSFRNTSPTMQAKYFYKEREGWRVNPELHSQIEWTKANLAIETEIQNLATASIIFCRNVFIYFSEQNIRKTVRLFYKYMPVPGYLCVAASESLLKLTNDFEFQEIGGAFVYVKR